MLTDATAKWVFTIQIKEAKSWNHFKIIFHISDMLANIAFSLSHAYSCKNTILTCEGRLRNPILFTISHQILPL